MPLPSRRLSAVIVNGFADAPDPFCQLGMACSAGEIPEQRGICVVSGDSRSCWDMCNKAHAPMDYLSGSVSQDTLIGSSVSQVRAGQNTFTECPALASGTSPSPLGGGCVDSKVGERCGASNVPRDQGVCVLDGSATVCWDMCDRARDPTDYVTGSTGETKKTAQVVASIREGSDATGSCPSDESWWPWIIVLLLLLLLLAFCVLYMFYSRRGKKTRALKVSEEPEPVWVYEEPEPVYEVEEVVPVTAPVLEMVPVAPLMGGPMHFEPAVVQETVGYTTVPALVEEQHMPFHGTDLFSVRPLLAPDPALTHYQGGFPSMMSPPQTRLGLYGAVPQQPMYYH